ncbi:MAG: indole-3-glycerol phosphate synthase TrpC [Candidatus Omnitrophota bacterium]
MAEIKADKLKEIIARKKERILSAKQILTEDDLRSKVGGLKPCRPFIEAINKPRQVSLIAEIKKASPSRGVIRADFHPSDIARAYEGSGAQAISVLTEEDYFLGNISYLAEVKDAVGLPVLRKDFILEPYQIYESRYFGADAVLLIADLLPKEKLTEFIALADSLGMDCLVEAHAEKDLKKILGLKVTPLSSGDSSGVLPAGRKASKKTVVVAIGINNRNLHSLEVDLKSTEKLYPLIPKDRVVVVESGLNNRQDVLFLKILGVNAVLIGEAFMAEADISRKVAEIMGW